uniref:Protein kinase domain-containing protein n=1 Tax=Aegilops tauschii subsp. strangulata TaxID=200361 RepID=A0A453JL54_AEGTS
MLYGILDDFGNKFPRLEYLGLSGNHFTGTIPSSISNISSLISVGFDSNRFSGYFPPTIGKLGALQYLNLNNNKLEANDNKGWEFITSLANCSYCDNRISGSIPADIGNLVGLQTLVIANTSMSGVIPKSIGKLENLIDLALYNNSLSGLIPPSLGNLSQLNKLYARNSNLEGPIPPSLGKLKNLFVLDLKMNYRLNGSIPKEIFRLPSLSWYLDLSYNSLSGPLPNEVGSLANLNLLVLSGNQLSGKIPDSIQNCMVLEQLFLDNNSFEGNIPQSLTNIKGVAAVGAIVFSLSVIVLVWRLCKKLKSSQKTVAKDSIVDGHYRRIPYPALLKGTNEFSEANLLGRGSYGAVYKCVLDNEERTLAVKVFNLGQSRYSKSFEAECEAMRRIRHRCLIKIITSCSSINHQGQEFKALVFEFMPNGNLDSWLHQPSQDPTTNNTLSLTQRFDIAIDIVDAVEYLHNYCQPLVIHCDLKPSNILLAEDMSARVGDFGISRILQENTSEGMQSSYGSIGIRGSVGYVAPGD